MIGAIFVAPTAASAASDHVKPKYVTICDGGTTVVSFGGISTSNVILHDKQIANTKGNTVKDVDGVTEVKSVTATVTVSAEMSVSASDVISSMSDKVGLTVAASGTETVTTSQSVEVDISAAGTYAVYNGTKKYTGDWSGYICNSRGTAETDISGDATSWAVAAEGDADCASSYSSGSFQAEAKTIAC